MHTSHLKKKKDFLSKSRESWFEDKLYYFYNLQYCILSIEYE